MNSARGVTLIDTLVAIFLMIVIFSGIFAAFKLSVDVVTNNKARAGAIALADERMEYIRSLSYSSIGTVGGVPTGTLAQTESVSLNGISYTRRTLVVYVDDPADGTGVSDATGAADYKAVKVDVSWGSRTGARDIYIVSRFQPTPDTVSAESSVSGGTLVINVLNASSQPVPSAQVTITNAATTPPSAAINLTTFTNTSGVVSVVGATSTGSYSITVTKSGYSTDQTYSITNSVRNPLTVSNGQTTTGTFSIDQLSSDTLITLAYGSAAPITSASVAIRGAKTIATNPTQYKYSATVGGGSSATTTLSNMEWDTYTMSVSAGTGYDLASSCSPQPVAIAPGTAVTTTLYLAPHTTSSLPVKVVASGNGALISGASVRLYKTGYDTTQTTDVCGQTFFSSLSSGTYSLTVSASGHTTFNSASVSVGTTTAVYPVSLN